MADRKGDCYVKAVDVMVEAHMGTEAQAFRLCHGAPIGRGPIDGVRFGHAWVEVADMVVIDKSNGLNVAMLRDRYYAIGNIDPTEVVRYTYDEMAENMRKHKTYGPWHETDARHGNDRT